MKRSSKHLLLGLSLLAAGLAGLLLMGLLAPGPRFGGPLSNYTSNGQRVFFTGVGSDGRPIPFDEGAFWLRMHGGGCATCHGSDGRGGRPMMLNVLAPDIRYPALSAAGFDDGLIARAITSGLDEEGKPLDTAMPRWHMSATDLADVIAYLKTLR